MGERGERRPANGLQTSPHGADGPVELIAGEDSYMMHSEQKYQEQKSNLILTLGVTRDTRHAKEVRSPGRDMWRGKTKTS